jgi:hypothetical protein
MTAEHWLLTSLSFVTLLYVAWSMGRIHTALRAIAASAERIETSAEHIAQMVRELHNR